MDEATADRLLDWIDADSEPRLQGNEAGARNSIPILVEELAFLQSRPPDQLGSLDQNDDPNRPAWLNYLTVYSAERNESADGRPRIFLNAPDLRKLHGDLSESLSKTIANYIILFRQYGPDTAQPSNQTQLVGSATEPIDFSVPATIDIADLTQLINSVVTIPGVETDGQQRPPRTVPSPILFGSGQQGSGTSGVGGEQPIDEIFDRLTLTTETRLTGRINVLTAPVEVLAAIPGLDESLAERIVRGRQNIDDSFRHPIGLLSSLSLDLTIVRAVIPYLTVAGDVVRAEFVGSAGGGSLEDSRPGPPTYRCEVILDASEGQSRQAVFRRLSNAGLPNELEIETSPAPVPNVRL